jgi:hypothetical protein
MKLRSVQPTGSLRYERGTAASESRPIACFQLRHGLPHYTAHTDAVDATPPEPPRMLDRRKLLWWAFWFVFLSTPVFGMFLPTAMSRLPFLTLLPVPRFILLLASLVGGAFAAGFLLSRLTSQTTGQFVRRGIGFGLALTTVYAIIGFAGCFLIM